jgi:hypothetical protein
MSVEKRPRRDVRLTIPLRAEELQLIDDEAFVADVAAATLAREVLLKEMAARRERRLRTEARDAFKLNKSLPKPTTTPEEPHS